MAKNVEKTGKFVIRIDPSMHERLAQLADTQHRSLNSQVAHIFESYFDASLLRRRLEELEERN